MISDQHGPKVVAHKHTVYKLKRASPPLRNGSHHSPDIAPLGDAKGHRIVNLDFMGQITRRAERKTPPTGVNHVNSSGQWLPPLSKARALTVQFRQDGLCQRESGAAIK